MRPSFEIRLRRAYDGPPTDGSRAVLVDRLWPRGIRKGAFARDAWIKDVAPSPGLRRWFNHDPERWVEFRRRYRTELAAKRDAIAPLLAIARRGDLTLQFGARDLDHNHAIVLKAHLDRLLAAERAGAK